MKFWKVYLTHSHDGRGLDFIKSAWEPPGSSQDVSIKLHPYPSLSPIINIYSSGRVEAQHWPSLNHNPMVMKKSATDTFGHDLA